MSILTLIVLLIVVSLIVRFARHRCEQQQQRQRNEQLRQEGNRRRLEQRNARRLEQAMPNQTDEQMALAKLQERIRATENALIVKQVIADSDGTSEQLILGNPTQGTPKPQPEEEEGVYDFREKSSCVICLQPFSVGDLVAWSRRGNHCQENAEIDNNCQHVFHRDCIEVWLINTGHDECPSCRTKLLQSELPIADDVETGLHNEDGSSMRFVIKDGLVTRLTPTSSNKDEKEHEVPPITPTAPFET